MSNGSVASRISRVGEGEVEQQDWGRLEWRVAGSLANSDALTVGYCYLGPGQGNPRHYHPNCDEVLVVLEGEVSHSLGDEEFALATGDMISIPQGVLHHAQNTGSGTAKLLICFSTADRQAVGE